MPGYLDTRPEAVNLHFRPGSALTVVTDWTPAGYLAGKDFTATLDGDEMGLTVVGDQMTLTATAAATGAITGTVEWFLLLDGDPVLMGTWVASNAAGTGNHEVSINVGDGVTVEVSVFGAPLGPAEALHGWYSASDWNAFTEHPVTVAPSGNAITLGGSNGIGTAAANGAGGNDRRFYELTGFRAADAEVRCDFDPGAAQLALGLRHIDGTGLNGVAVVASWCNIVFGNTVAHLWGVWEWDGVNSFPTNQGGSNLNGFISPVLSSSGNGTTVTVKTRYSHGVTAGDIVHFDSSLGFGAFGQVTVASTPDAHTLTFSSATSGSGTGGTYRWVVPYAVDSGRQRVAARLIGNRLTYKQWLPFEAEPAWADTLRAKTVTLPSSLSGGHPVPAGVGGWGFFVNHLTDAASTVSVNDFRARSLDGVGVS